MTKSNKIFGTFITLTATAVAVSAFCGYLIGTIDKVCERQINVVHEEPVVVATEQAATEQAAAEQVVAAVAAAEPTVVLPAGWQPLASPVVETAAEKLPFNERDAVTYCVDKTGLSQKEVLNQVRSLALFHEKSMYHMDRVHYALAEYCQKVDSSNNKTFWQYCDLLWSWYRTDDEATCDYSWRIFNESFKESYSQNFEDPFAGYRELGYLFGRSLVQ
jgi:zona occludens toxin (predicted ATPase)